MERTEKDLAIFKATFDRSGSPRSLAHLRWQYLENPTERLHVQFAVPEGDEGRAAAIYAVMPVRMRVSGRVVLGAQSLDTLTDVEFRGKGLFVKQAKALFERCREEDFACVYGFPNGNSAPGFFRKLEWARLDPVPFLMKPLRANYFLRRVRALGSLATSLPPLPLAFPRRATLSRSQEIRPVTSFDTSFDALWERFAQGVGAAVHRDARYLEWRLLKKPDFRYRMLGLYEHGLLIAFVALDVTEKHGGRIGYVLELLHEPGRGDAASQLLQEAIAEMAADGTEVILAWCLDHSPNRGAYRKQGFMPLPERLRPIELHVGVRPLAAPVEANLGNRHNWYLSYLDSDTV